MGEEGAEMCIRDSYKIKDQTGIGRLGLVGIYLPGNDYSLEPVSYTHLDVYKRQLQQTETLYQSW